MERAAPAGQGDEEGRRQQEEQRQERAGQQQDRPLNAADKETKAQKIAEQYSSLDSLLKADPEAVYRNLVGIHGFGDERAGAVRDYLSDPQTQALLHKFISLGLSPNEPVVSTGPLFGGPPPPREQEPLRLHQLIFWN